MLDEPFKMEEIRFTETEQRYFGDLFVMCCDAANAEKVSLLTAAELFRTSNVPSDIIEQIIDLCTGGKSRSFGRKQFYTALKLIAASQTGMSIHSIDSINSQNELPLPKFLWSNYEVKDNNSHLNMDSPDLIELSDSKVVKTNSIERLNSSEGELDDVTEKSNKSPKNRRPSVGEASSTASDSPTPTNSVQEKSWATAGNWLGLVSEEQRQLLGTEEESSDKHSSDDEADKELWTITNEQREYYTTQFRSLQPDPSGQLAGSTARLFFEKSKLPVHELRKIWQLSDVTKDGALSLEEFNVAMHLVVLRRNNIPLPDELPPSLILTNTSSIVQPPPPPPPHEENSPEIPTTSCESRGVKQWTKFVDSPTSSISSPGPKPVNFDFHKSAVEQDPKIYHPVPVRVTPESASNFANNENECCKSPRRLEYENEGSYYCPKKNSVSNPSQENSDLRSIQRPQPRKPAPGPGAIPPPPQQQIDEGFSGPTSLPVCVNNHSAPKKEPPPPPPPRPYRTHTRSSSLDLNKLGKSSILAAPPAVPPRMSPSTTSPKKLISQRSEDDVPSLVGQNTAFADFSQFPSAGDNEVDEEIEQIDGLPRMHGAFQIYRKQIRCESPVMRIGEAKRLEEHNNLLTRLCYELSQELLQVQEERNALQLKLEQLQSKHNS